MYRAIEEELKQWFQSKQRLPLLIRGARQVGKTHVIRKFGHTHFQHLVEINFELEPHYADCFHSLDPNTIINAIQALSRQSINADNTLLFFDEIQTCPKAIMALRYFKEIMPELAIVAAGSLLEFALQEPNFSMPVGRVQYLYLKPLSFQEFLQANKYDHLLEQVKKTSLSRPIDDVIHKKLLSLFKQYSLLGGMPAVINTFLETEGYLDCQRMQTVILSTYRSDFGKYAKITQHHYLQRILDLTPALLGQQIKYTKIDPDVRSALLKQAIQLLKLAGIVHPVYATSASGLPLSALINEKKYKLLFLDVGLANRAGRTDIQTFLEHDLMQINQGGLAEQCVGQELFAYQDCYEPPQLFFWARDKKGAQAEVDYVIDLKQRILPIEVKAGVTGRLKSLKGFMEEKSSSLGIRISQLPLNYADKILTVPFYLIGELTRLIQNDN